MFCQKDLGLNKSSVCGKFPFKATNIFAWNFAEFLFSPFELKKCFKGFLFLHVKSMVKFHDHKIPLKFNYPFKFPFKAPYMFAWNLMDLLYFLRSSCRNAF